MLGATGTCALTRNTSVDRDGASHSSRDLLTPSSEGTSSRSFTFTLNRG